MELLYPPSEILYQPLEQTLPGRGDRVGLTRIGATGAGVLVTVGVLDGMDVRVAVLVAVGVRVEVAVRVGVGVRVAVLMMTGVLDGVYVFVDVNVCVGV